MTTYTDYSLIAKDMSASLQRVSEKPDVARETEYYNENIGNVKSIEEFLADDRLFNYAMKAHGLEDMSYAKGLMRKVLEGGIDDESAMANQFTDSRYYDFAAAFDFVGRGENATIFTSAQQDVVDKYLQQTLEEDAGADNEGVRLALYFERKMPEILEESTTDNSIAYEIIADPALSEVFRTAFQIPDELATLDVDAQAELFMSKIDFADFGEADKMSEFMERFTTLWEVENPSSYVASAADLLGSQSGFGVSTDLMISINSLKTGGS